MIKHLFLFTLCSILFYTAFAQKKDTSVYYLQNSGKIVSTKDSADFFVVILPPDTTVDRNLFIVNEFYRNGKVAMVGNSTTNTLANLKFEGSQITFFPNGHKMVVKNFEHGKPIGDIVQYYPNGRFYNKTSYIKTVTGATVLQREDCNDSTGNILSENGNGKWIKFNEGFSKIDEAGQIEDGFKVGEWRSKVNDTVDLVDEYKKGELASSVSVYKSGNKIYAIAQIVPEFPGGINAFSAYLGKNIRYPDDARRKGVQGRVIIHFVVDKDGTLSDVRIARGVDYSIDLEALRVIKESPLWKPGMQDGKPVNCAFTVPIAFTLSN